jgi:energy-coupling factor transporter transmembrane protein EcfT
VDIGTVDLWATHYRSWLHSATLPSKCVLAAAVLLTVVLAEHALLLVATYVLLLTLLLTTPLPVFMLVGTSMYTVLFVAVFAISRWDGTWLTPLTIVAKAPTMALVVLLLVATTPYPRIFALFNRFLPSIVADSLLLAYRAVFVLLEFTRRLLLSLRLRGGLGGGSPWQRVKNLSIGLGLVFVHSMDYVQRLYMVMRLRGYAGRMAAGSSGEAILRNTGASRKPSFPLQRNDTPLFAVAFVTVASALIVRESGADWPMYGLLILSVLVLAGTQIYRMLRRAAK